MKENILIRTMQKFVLKMCNNNNKNNDADADADDDDDDENNNYSNVVFFHLSFARL